MLFCPHCQQLESTTHETREDGAVTYRCKKCGGNIPLRRDLRPGEIVAGFEIQSELGRGAMGIVYQARQTNLDREVAIKILSDDSASDEVYVERFFREARAAASLSHPNVVQAYDAGVTSDGIYYFVMEKITGENLELVLNNVGPLNVQQALDVFLSVANALAYAWSHNQLSHGDIKPENIIMRLNGKVKLADFGLARRAMDPDLAEEDIRATPAYAPPEIIRGDKNVPGFKSDMYSFGATAYHILNGREPFVDSDPFKVCDMQVKDTQTPLCELHPAIPKRLSDLVDSLMQKDPEKRPASWEDVVTELEAIQLEVLEAERQNAAKAGADGEAGEGDEGDEAGGKDGRRIVVVILAAAVLVLALIAGGILYFGGYLDDPGYVRIDPKPQQKPGQTRPGQNGSRDEAYYLSRWQTLKREMTGDDPDLTRLERFVAEAGLFAPAEAVRMLQTLTAKKDPEQAVKRVLALRNELMDKAVLFDPVAAEKMDFFAVADLCESVKKQYDELKNLDSTLEEHLLQPDQRLVIDAYYAQLASLLVTKSLSQSETEQEPPKPDKKDADSKTAETDKSDESGAGSNNNGSQPGEDSALNREAAKILANLNDTIDDESLRAPTLRALNELLSNPEFTDEALRKDCVGARRFLVLNQSSLLSHLNTNKKALRGVVLFPRTNSESRLEDLTDGTFRMRITTRSGNILQRLKWADIRREEGEDSMVVALINSSQLQKLTEEFREFLLARAMFYGVGLDSLKARFNRAAGLSASKKEELFHTLDLFRAPEPVEEEDEEFLPDEDDFDDFD